jgi:hypothetical protein
MFLILRQKVCVVTTVSRVMLCACEEAARLLKNITVSGQTETDLTCPIRVV